MHSYNNTLLGIRVPQFATEEMDPETSTLWFAGKQMLPEKLLKDYLGRHEKTKVIVKLQKKGSGAPGREPVSSHRWGLGSMQQCLSYAC